MILNRYTPKIVILEFDPDASKYEKDNYEKLSVLLPYSKIFKELKPIIELHSKSEKIKFLSQIYPYNSSILSSLRYFTTSDSSKNTNYNGFVPIINKTISKITNNIASPLKVYASDTNILHALNDIISLCDQKHVKLIIVNSPEYYNYNESKKTTIEAGSLALNIINKSKTTYLLDNTYDTNFIGKYKLFADRRHLNIKGAELYSEIFSKQLNELMKQN